MTLPVREIEEDENKLELGRIVWDEEIGGAVIEWCADEMPMMSSAAIDSISLYYHECNYCLRSLLQGTAALVYLLHALYESIRV